jgi:hypothetical protein
MAIRKTGAVTGQVIGFGQDPAAGGITAEGSLALRSAPPGLAWEQDDEQALAGENEEADRG